MKAKKLFPDISFRRLARPSVPVDNLESTDVDRPLSANMGREIKELVDENTNSINELNENITWKLAGSASGTNNVSIAGISYEEILIYIVNNKEGDGQAGWYDTSLVIPKVALINRRIINMPAFNHKEGDHLYCVCAYDKHNELIRIYVHALADTSVIDYSTLYVYYR